MKINSFIFLKNTFHVVFRRFQPPLGPIFFIFMQFSGKIGQIIGWCTSPMDPSAPGFDGYSDAIILLFIFHFFSFFLNVSRNVMMFPADFVISLFFVKIIYFSLF